MASGYRMGESRWRLIPSFQKVVLLSAEQIVLALGCDFLGIPFPCNRLQTPRRPLPNSR